MCGLCGVLGRGLSWEQQLQLGESARWQMRQHATQTARRLTTLLGAARVKVTVNTANAFVIAFPTGGVEVAASIAEVWHVLEKRRIVVPDPLA
jgi:hypothetical protein